MPAGPGAPSDAGPDGGLVDPGMVGPDGVPVDDGGPPPGEDAEPDGGPQDDAAGGAAGDGPPSASGGDDDTGSAPPKKGKSKKESARRYHGADGQALTEGQLLRHVAVRVSGADPRVLAAMRAESAQGRFREAAVNPSWKGYQGSPEQAMDERLAPMGLYGAAGAAANTELGHNVQVGQDRETGHWSARVYHPRDSSGASVRLHLGQDEEMVPHLLNQAFRHRGVTQLLGEQYQRSLANTDENGRMISRRPRRHEDQPQAHEFDFGPA